MMVKEVSFEIDIVEIPIEFLDKESNYHSLRSKTDSVNIEAKKFTDDDIDHTGIDLDGENLSNISRVPDILEKQGGKETLELGQKKVAKDKKDIKWDYPQSLDKDDDVLEVGDDSIHGSTQNTICSMLNKIKLKGPVRIKDYCNEGRFSGVSVDEDKEAQSILETTVNMGWNIRGLGKSENKKNLMNLIGRWKPKVEERVNSLRRWKDMEYFNQWIQRSNLPEIQIENANFTWIGPNGKRSNLDRVLVNSEWFSKAYWSLKALPRKNSDYRGLILFPKQLNWGPKPFRIFNICLSDINLKKKIDDHFIQDLVVEEKLVKLEEENGPRNELEILKMSLEDLSLIKDRMLKQKARVEWLKEGDRNSKFFHQAIQRRRARNMIRKIQWKGGVLTEPSEIKQTAKEHF
ncbi:hypothetical protein POM88_020059 [Heracleum sosnowskyi]|uniref:RNA-directed DNA polymerase, eukaryota, reverse transcriptase zinc-binding domain protein n=1 Tax=Heracleum sosnowskyi TaxID=360622 RepID=A0AAD8MRM2_9APIA|nr:hypothetical protein POM88_020059 [Heracleum sosnowskyi]